MLTQGNKMFAEVALPQGDFTYAIPEKLQDKVNIGCSVNVMLRGRKEYGWVTGFKSKAPVKDIKDISEVISVPLFSENIIKLANWIATYYICPLGEVLNAMVPSVVREKGALPSAKELVRLGNKPIPSSSNQRFLIKYLLTRPFGANKVDIRKLKLGSSIGYLKKKGVIETFERELLIPHKRLKSTTFTKLANEEENALKQIKTWLLKNEFKTLLLHNESKESRSRIYARAIDIALKQGKDTILLVPEIEYIQEIFTTLRDKFGDIVTIFHSKLSEKARKDIWIGIRAGKYRVVLGARSAVFAPMKKLGLIIVDEEQSDYKQIEKPKYSARDVAVMRAKIESSLCVLGTKAPSIESFYNAQKDKFDVITFKKRAALPIVSIVDMRKTRGVISNLLGKKMASYLKQGQKTILFVDRKGFAGFLLCKDCGHIPRCLNCGVTLKYYREDFSIRCPYCGFRQSAPNICPICKGTNLTYRGVGTQRVEREVKKLFSKAQVLRVDLDVNDKDKIVQSFEENGSQILIGTRMIVKEKLLRMASLAAVISCDTMLSLPDFRAPEKTFDLLTEFMNVKENLVLQTYNPDHYVFKNIKSWSYSDFYNFEIKQRKELKYPPLSHPIRIIIESKKEKKIEELTQLIRNRLPSVDFLGPAPCLVPQKRGKLRYHMLLKIDSPAKISTTLQEIYKKHTKNLTIETDPIELA
jgi:primosomal protein N' (replication factor Y)